MPYKYWFFYFGLSAKNKPIPNLQKTASSIKPQFCNNSTIIIKRFCVFLRNIRVLHFMGVSRRDTEVVLSFLDQVLLHFSLERFGNRVFFFFFPLVSELKFNIFKIPNFCLQGPSTCVSIINIGQESIRILINSKTSTLFGQEHAFLNSIINDI